MDALTLYVDGFWISPYALSAFVALEEKGLSYTAKEVRLNKGEHRGDNYRAHTGRVPALQHGDYWLAESSAIAEYLAETFPFPKHPRLFPEDLRQRGICREVQAFVRSDLMPIRNERSTHTVWYEHTDKPLSDAAKVAVDRLYQIADRLIPEGKTSLFDAWCIADTDLAMMLQRLNLNGDPMPKKLKAFAEAQWARPSVAKWNDRKRAAYEPY
jgi:glutathione S-transferase